MFVSAPAMGHFHPLVPLALALHGAGDDVVVASAPSVCARATVGFWLNTVGQVCLFTWLVIAAGGRRFVAPLWSLVAAANLSVAVLALSSLVTASANRW